MNLFEQRAREILASESQSSIDAFLQAFGALRQAMGLILPEDKMVFESPSGDTIELPKYSEYDASDRAKRLEKQVKKTKDALNHLAAQPEFKFHSEEFRAMDLVLREQLMVRNADHPKGGRPKIPLHKEMILWALDYCLAEELPDVGRSFKEGTRSAALADALLGRSPPSDIRSRLDQYHQSCPDSVGIGVFLELSKSTPTN